ncbi:MAG: hypothetical protein KF893_10845 [Caldilineaceae bacterium]|nr:hypothetical protein [Caldilineaceae bacterium]
MQMRLRLRRNFNWAMLITLLALLIASATSIQAVNIGNHQVDFIAVEYNTPSSGRSTWYYKVTSGANPEISHVTFALGGCLKILDAGTWNGSNTNSRSSGAGSPDPSNFPANPKTDPTTGTTGQKFNRGFAVGETRYYYITVDGNYAAQNITVALKGGPGFVSGTVTGPSPTCAIASTPTATRTPTRTPVPPTATPTNTPTKTPVPPTVTPTSTATRTPTNTPVPPTATPTNTPTNTPTATATATNTSTATPTATATTTPIPLEPDFEITKRLNTLEPVRTGEMISFTIRITNTGNVTISELPLNDTYQTAFLVYVGSSPYSDDNISDGSINWSDLTAAASTGFDRDLEPGESFEVVVEFVAKADTTSLPNGATVNTATVNGAFYDPDGPGGTPPQGPLPPKSAQDDVVIFAPTAVAVSTFMLGSQPGEVEIQWQTINETKILKFNLYRVSDNSRTHLISLPAARIGQPAGHTYTYRDTSATSGILHTYWLEIIGPNNSVSAIDLGSIYASDWMLYLPLTQR